MFSAIASCRSSVSPIRVQGTLTRLGQTAHLPEAIALTTHARPHPAPLAALPPPPLPQPLSPPDRPLPLAGRQKTLGKGSVQPLFTLGAGSGLYVTVGRYTTPSGQVIDKEGLSPDVEVDGEMTKEADKDDQLKRAKSELRALISGKRATVPKVKVGH